MWRWSLENWKLCLTEGCFHLSFVGLWKKTKQQQKPANGKEACQDDQVQVCLKFVKGIARFLFGKTFVLNCALRWNFQLTLLDKITIQFRFFIGFVWFACACWSVVVVVVVFFLQFSLPSQVSITRFYLLLEYNIKFINERCAFSPV